METSTLPTHKRNKRKTFLIPIQAEWRQRKACARELGFSLLRRAKRCFLASFPSGPTINWVWPWHYCEEAWEITCVFSYFDAAKPYFWWQQPSPFCLVSWPIFYFHPRKQCLYLSIPQPCHHLPWSQPPRSLGCSTAWSLEQRFKLITLALPPDEPWDQAKCIWASVASSAKQDITTCEEVCY